MYQLYYTPGAASFAVHWILIELDQPFELIGLDFSTQEQKSSDYLKLNPLGQVPTLIVDGQPCTETTALLMLLAERHPEAGLAPAAGDPERAKYLGLMVYLANTLMPAFRAWFYPQDFGDAGDEEAVRENARGRIEAAFGQLDARLADG